MPAILSPTLPADSPQQRQIGARFALLTLSAINLLNYADRYVPSSVKGLLKEELHLTDTETSLPATGMVIVYMICSVVFGWLADKDLVDRRLILSVAIAFWSCATAVAGLAQDAVQLIAFRSLVGVGEAAYMAIAPVMISDFYPPSERNMAFTIFGLAMPLGGALGYAVGAGVGGLFGWRIAFLACGSPGLMVAFLVLLINNPTRGVNDGDLQEKSEKKSSTPLHDLQRIISTPAYVFATAGMVASSFALGALADWYDEFLTRSTNTSVSVAGLVLGAATAIGGIGGSLLGAKTAQHFDSRLTNAYFIVPAVFTLPGAALCWAAVNFVQAKYLAYVCVTLSEVFVFTYSAPLATISISVIPPEMRARSAGLQIFCIHVLGDVISPPIVGAISDRDGLQSALQLTWIMFLVSGFWWFAGGRCLKPLPKLNTESKEASLASLLCSGERRPGKAQGDESSDPEDSGSGEEEQKVNLHFAAPHFAGVELGAAPRTIGKPNPELQTSWDGN